MTDFQSELSEVVEEYCSAFPHDLASVFNIVRSYKYSSARPIEVAITLQAELHRMAGAAQCMGFRKVGKKLSQIEQSLGKAIKNRRHEVEDVLEAALTKLVEVSEMRMEIIPENSRALYPSEIAANAMSLADRFSETEKMRFAEMRILVADDDAYVRSSLLSSLHEIGVRNVRTANSGLDVLNIIGHFSPDVIVTDWHMAPVSGIEVLQCIRNGGTNLPTNLPMIFFTSENDHESRMQAMCDGVDRFLTKPVSPRVLGETLLTVCGYREIA